MNIKIYVDFEMKDLIANKFKTNLLNSQKMPKMWKFSS